MAKKKMSHFPSPVTSGLWNSVSVDLASRRLVGDLDPLLRLQLLVAAPARTVVLRRRAHHVGRSGRGPVSVPHVRLLARRPLSLSTMHAASPNSFVLSQEGRSSALFCLLRDELYAVELLLHICVTCIYDTVITVPNRIHPLHSLIFLFNRAGEKSKGESKLVDQCSFGSFTTISATWPPLVAPPPLPFLAAA